MVNNKEKNCIFCKIIEGDIESDIIYKDREITAFKDADPQAPVHVLIVPREHIATVNDASPQIVAKCTEAAKKIAKNLNIAQSGYRIVINCNKDGGQEVDHLHVHLLGGRKLGWPPG
jgi:histidine triad (HIT) family protein